MGRNRTTEGIADHSVAVRCNQQRIRAVTFDAAGTLIEPREPVGQTYARAARDYGLEVEPEVLEARFREAYAHARPLCFPDLPESELLEAERTWWRELVRRVFESFPREKVDCIFEWLFAHYARAESWRVFPDVRPALQALRERGVVLGIVSNFDARLFALCTELGLSPFFRVVVASSRVGFAKPQPEIFLYALRALGVHPEESLHVGDSWREDVLGARAAGLLGLLIRRGEVRTQDQIDDLRALCKWVEAAACSSVA